MAWCFAAIASAYVPILLAESPFAAMRSAGEVPAGAEADTKQGDALCLPFADNSFDAYTIAFGIRNVTNIPKALREAHRVLKRGGRFFCLEFSTTEWPGFGELYDKYGDRLIPKIGKVVADAVRVR